jgi:hypothetical protein
MQPRYALLLATSLTMLACQNPDPLAPASTTILPNQDLEALYQRFHGKYQVVSATASQPLDVNLDGVASTNLLKEMAALSENSAFLELRVKYPDRSVFLFSQFWPEQYVYSFTKPGNLHWNGWDMLAYNPAYSVQYAQQANPYSFSFNDDLSQVMVAPNSNADSTRWAKPESVLVEANEQLRLVNKRRIYTREGVKEVLITTIYKRFTITT